MQQSRESPLPHFFFQDRGAIGVSVTGMDDQRQLGLPRGGDVGSKNTPGDLPGSLVVVIIEPRFAQSDAFRMVGERDNFFDSWLYFFM